MVSQGKAGQAYQRIEQLIVSEELTPGNLVSEAVLMEKTGLGRTPIREALQQLARNRMVEHLSQCPFAQFKLRLTLANFFFHASSQRRAAAGAPLIACFAV